MKSLWSDEEAASLRGPLGPRVYSSRLLGRDKSLVLHGGGNTSVKLREKNLFGEDEEVLYVKGSGRDLETIGPEGFAPLALDPLRRLATLPALGDGELANQLATHVLSAAAPSPSVETLLHAFLPHAYIDHTHADAVLAISNARRGDELLREAYGESAVVVPYVMSGFELARACARELGAGGRAIGMVLASHGLVSFGAGARESYERMIRLVTLAEQFLEKKKARAHVQRGQAAAAKPEEIAALRREIAAAAGFSVVLRTSASEKLLAFARHADVARLAQGPATPDHVLFTKPWPMLGRDVAAFCERYRAYFEGHARAAGEPKTMLDPAPRMVLDAQMGFAAAGRSAREAAIVEDLYDHTVDVILAAEALGGWRPLPEREIFEVEYWGPEQAKRRGSGAPPKFAGEIALVTGAASGIGRACVEAFLERGAAVAALDVNPAVETMWRRDDVLGVTCDLTRRGAVSESLDRAARVFGGLDMLVLNAGVFPSTESVESIAPESWRRAMEVNVEANLALLQLCHPLLRLAPRGGRIVVIGSRNVPAPGAGAAAYSASKAALNQLARVVALEWAKDGIRINSLHPDAVYDTGLWTEELLASRAKAYNLSVEQYKKRNLLKTEVSSKDVAALAAEMCGPLFAKTTGAQVPVDGGNERVV